MSFECIVGTVMTQPSVNMLGESVYLYWLSVVHCSTVIQFLFPSVLLLFDSFCLIIQCSIIHLVSVFFCPDTGIVFQVFWSLLLPTNNHPSVNKHHSSDSLSFVLIQEARAYCHHFMYTHVSSQNFGFRMLLYLHTVLCTEYRNCYSTQRDNQEAGDTTKFCFT
jgi:hypothetical protein